MAAGHPDGDDRVDDRVDDRDSDGNTDADPDTDNTDSDNTDSDGNTNADTDGDNTDSDGDTDTDSNSSIDAGRRALETGQLRYEGVAARSPVPETLFRKIVFSAARRYYYFPALYKTDALFLVFSLPNQYAPVSDSRHVTLPEDPDSPSNLAIENSFTGYAEAVTWSFVPVRLYRRALGYLNAKDQSVVRECLTAHTVYKANNVGRSTKYVCLADMHCCRLHYDGFMKDSQTGHNIVCYVP